MIPMPFFKLVEQETVRLTHESGDWIEVRKFLSKAEIKAIRSRIPVDFVELADENVRNDPKAAAVVIIHGSPEFSQLLFEVLVTGWSMPVPPTVANYLMLEPEPAEWIDNELFAHYTKAQTPSKEELGKPSTSPRGSRKGTRETA